MTKTIEIDTSGFVPPKSILCFTLADTKTHYNDETYYKYKNESFNYYIEIVRFKNEKEPLYFNIANKIRSRLVYVWFIQKGDKEMPESEQRIIFERMNYVLLMESFNDK